MHQQSLPLEIILIVIDFIVPSSKPSPLALPPNHPTTKTLHALALTSRSIYPIARSLLYHHCMYIDGLERISLLLRTLLSPSAVPECPDLLPSVTSLFLRFDLLHYTAVGDVDLEQVQLAITNLLHVLRSNLRRLSIDIPIDYLYAHLFDSTPPAAFSNALEGLQVLEEFGNVYCCKPRVNFAHPKGEFWPGLKKLVLYFESLDTEFLAILSRWESLEGVVLVRSEFHGEIDLQEEWANLFQSEADVRPLNIVLFDMYKDDLPILYQKDDKLQVRLLKFPSTYHDESYEDLNRDWIRQRVLSGLPISEWS